MGTPEIIAGHGDQVCPGSGNGLVVDVAMTMNTSRVPGSGVWHGPGRPCTKSFGEHYDPPGASVRHPKTSEPAFTDESCCLSTPGRPLP